MFPLSAQEGEGQLAPHGEPSQVEDEVNEVHAEEKKKILILLTIFGRGTDPNLNLRTRRHQLRNYLDLALDPSA